MPAALTVDQSLVDNYLARVDRFCDNVKKFEETLGELTSGLKEKFMPAESKTEAPVYDAYEEASAVQSEPKTVTADDIDLDALLAGIDFGQASASL